MKKITSLVVSFVMILSICTTAMGGTIATAGGSGSTDVTLVAAAATFNVTVPTALSLDVSATGVVSTASSTSIINMGHGAVKVTGVTVTPTAPWAVVSFDTDMRKEKVGSTKVGIMMNTCKSTDAGVITFDQTKFPKMDGYSATGTSHTLPLTYSAVLPAQKTAVASTKIASVVFVVGWDV